MFKKPSAAVYPEPVESGLQFHIIFLLSILILLNAQVFPVTSYLQTCDLDFALLIAHIHTTCTTHLVLLCMINLTIFSEEYTL
jgi:hypothetical protein